MANRILGIIFHSLRENDHDSIYFSNFYRTIPHLDHIGTTNKQLSSVITRKVYLDNQLQRKGFNYELPNSTNLEGTFFLHVNLEFPDNSSNFETDFMKNPPKRKKTDEDDEDYSEDEDDFEDEDDSPKSFVVIWKQIQNYCLTMIIHVNTNKFLALNVLNQIASWICFGNSQTNNESYDSVNSQPIPQNSNNQTTPTSTPKASSANPQQQQPQQQQISAPNAGMMNNISTNTLPPNVSAPNSKKLVKIDPKKFLMQPEDFAQFLSNFIVNGVLVFKP